MVGILHPYMMGAGQGLLAPQEAPAAPMAQQSGGLLSMFMPEVGQNKFYQGFDRNREALANAFFGMVGQDGPRGAARGFAQGAMYGRESDRVLAEQRRKQDEAQKTVSQTVGWLSNKFGLSPEDAQAAASNPNILNHYLKLAQDKSGGAADLGLNPQYGVDANGNPVLLQLGKDGKVVQSQMPQGITLSKEPIKLDAGTHFVLLDPITRQPIGQIPKENYEEARQSAAGGAAGKAEGEAMATYRSMQSKMAGLENVVKELDTLSNQATYTLGGQVLDEGMKQLGMDPRQSAIARAQYIAIVDNQVLPLLRDTFGAAFTVKEGETLRATLGDPNKSPQEKQAVLRAFIEQKRRDIEALAQQSGAVAPPASAGGTGGYKIIGVE